MRPAHQSAHSERGTAEHLTVDLVRERAAPVLARYGASRAIVFGSVARGEPSRRSDVDLLVVKETPVRFLDRTEGLLEELSEAIPEAPVEVLVYTPEELERMRSGPFIGRALREGKVIYERE